MIWDLARCRERPFHIMILLGSLDKLPIPACPRLEKTTATAHANNSNHVRKTLRLSALCHAGNLQQYPATCSWLVNVVADAGVFQHRHMLEPARSRIESATKSLDSCNIAADAIY